MGVAPIPRTLDDLTPSWLETVLAAEGCLGDQRIKRIDTRLVSGGTGGGFLSDLVFLTVSYEPETPTAPTSLVLKKSRSTALPNFGAVQVAYGVEVKFYRELASEVPLLVPRCYFAEYDEQTFEFGLLLEDLSSLRAGDDLAGCTFTEATGALRAVARLHGKWWESRRLERPTFPERRRANPSAEQFTIVERDFGHSIPAEVFRLGRLLSDRLSEFYAALDSPPSTLVHHDYRLDNMMFPAETEGAVAPEPVILDWQLMRYTRGAVDVGFFLGEALPVEHRRQWEEHLLSTYHESLRDSGVKDYGFEQCIYDYRFSLLLNYLRWVGIYSTFSTTEGKQRDKAKEMFHRSAAAVSDFDALSLIENLGARA